MITTIIEPSRVDTNYWRDVWTYRELFQVLAWRDIAVRYKQTVIGIVWAVIRPALTMLIFTVIFSKVAKLPTDASIPYALMVFAGLLPWTFFASALADSSNSIILNSNLVSKIYFPRLILPVATIFSGLADFAISFLLFIITMAWYRFIPDWRILFLPVMVVSVFLVTLGPGLWVTALNVKYRDFRYVIPVVIQFGLYISPVGFSAKVVPEKWRTLYALNPLVGVIEGFRWCLLKGHGSLSAPSIFGTLFVIVVSLWLGVRQFRKTERAFADLV